jgi:hypothetical protein
LALRVPVLDEQGFEVLLADGPDAAREVAEMAPEPEPKPAAKTAKVAAKTAKAVKSTKETAE